MVGHHDEIAHLHQHIHAQQRFGRREILEQHAADPGVHRRPEELEHGEQIDVLSWGYLTHRHNVAWRRRWHSTTSGHPPG